MGRPESSPVPDAPDPEIGGPNREENEAFARALREGDVVAFDAFIRAHWRRLVYYLTERVRMRELAEDLAQDSLARLWERRESLDPSSSVLSYLYQIARNLAIDELRKVQVRRRWREQQRHQPAPTTSVTPLQRLEDQEALDALRHALAALPERRREAFMLVHVQHLSHRDAAAVMGNAPQTVANQVSAALAELRRALEPFLREGE